MLKFFRWTSVALAIPYLQSIFWSLYSSVNDLCSFANVLKRTELLNRESIWKREVLSHRSACQTFLYFRLIYSCCLHHYCGGTTLTFFIISVMSTLYRLKCLYALRSMSSSLKLATVSRLKQISCFRVKYNMSKVC